MNRQHGLHPAVFRGAGACALIFTLAIGLVMLSPSGAIAEPVDSDLPEDMLEDARRDAATGGGELTEIVSDLEIQELADRVLDPIIDKHEDVYAEAGLPGDGTAYIAFVGEAPAEALEELAPYPQIDVLEGATLSEKGAEDLMMDVFDIVGEDPAADGGDMFVHVAPITGAAEVATTSGVHESTRDKVSDAVRAAAEESAGSRAADAAVEGTWFDIDSTLHIEPERTDGTKKLAIMDTKSRNKSTVALPRR